MYHKQNFIWQHHKTVYYNQRINTADSAKKIMMIKLFVQ